MKITVISLILYFLFLMISKIVNKKILEKSKAIASLSETKEEKTYTESTIKRISFKITPPIAIIITFIPIINILFDIFLLIWIYMELLVLASMNYTLSK